MVEIQQEIGAFKLLQIRFCNHCKVHLFLVREFITHLTFAIILPYDL